MQQAYNQLHEEVCEYDETEIDSNGKVVATGNKLKADPLRVDLKYHMGETIAVWSATGVCHERQVEAVIRIYEDLGRDETLHINTGGHGTDLGE